MKYPTFSARVVRAIKTQFYVADIFDIHTAMSGMARVFFTFLSHFPSNYGRARIISEISPLIETTLRYVIAIVWYELQLARPSCAHQHFLSKRHDCPILMVPAAIYSS